MRLGKDLTGRPIFSITDGKNLGNVKDIYVNHDLDQITGVFVGQEGVLRRKSYLVCRENVTVFGIDAILVKNPDVIEEESQVEAAAGWVRLSKLRGRDVDTPNGTRVANIGDIVVGEEGDVIGFALSKVHVDGPIADNGAIARTAVLDTGNEDGVMTIDLTIAETTGLTAVVDTAEKAAPAAAEDDAKIETLPDEEL